MLSDPEVNFSKSKEVLPSQSAFSQVHQGGGRVSIQEEVTAILLGTHPIVDWLWASLTGWSTAGCGCGNVAASDAQADHLASSQETSSSPCTPPSTQEFPFLHNRLSSKCHHQGRFNRWNRFSPLSPSHPCLQCTQLTLMAETPRLANQLRIFSLCPSPHFLVSDWYLIMSGHSSRWTRIQTPSRRTPYTTPDLCPPASPHRSVAVETSCLWKWGGGRVMKICGGRPARKWSGGRSLGAGMEGWGEGGGGYVYLVFQTKLATG